MKYITLIVLLFLPTLVSAQTTEKCNLNDPNQLVQVAMRLSEQAEGSSDLRHKSKVAREGLAKAERCLKIQKNFMPCLYAHAVLLGLELETRTLNIADDLQKMVNEFEVVSHHSPQIDQGGAFYALGNVYLKAPVSLSLTGEIHRDLDKAMVYALEAVQVAVTARNLFLLGEVHYKRDEFDEAEKAFERLMGLKAAEKKGFKKKTKKYLKKIKKKKKN